MRLVVPILLIVAFVPASLLLGGLTMTQEGLAFSGAVAAGLFGTAGILFPGASRFTSPAEVLRHDVRKRLYAALQEGAGATLTQLTTRLDLTATNTLWHLRKLEQANLVRTRRFHGTNLYYVVEGGVQQRAMTVRVAVLAVENARDIVRHVVENPGVHQRELARAIGVNPGTIRWHVRKLIDAGVLVEEPRGATRAYYATDDGRAALGHTVHVPASSAQA